MRRVMRRAWEIVKTLEGDLRAKLSVALKQAWLEFKEESNELSYSEASNMVYETLEAKYYNLMFFSYEKGDTYVETYSTYIRIGRSSTKVTLAQITFSADGKILVSKDRDGIVKPLLENKRVIGVLTEKERKELEAKERAKDLERIKEYADYRLAFFA